MDRTIKNSLYKKREKYSFLYNLLDIICPEFNESDDEMRKKCVINLINYWSQIFSHTPEGSYVLKYCMNGTVTSIFISFICQYYQINVLIFDGTQCDLYIVSTHNPIVCFIFKQIAPNERKLQLEQHRNNINHLIEERQKMIAELIDKPAKEETRFQIAESMKRGDKVKIKINKNGDINLVETNKKLGKNTRKNENNNLNKKLNNNLDKKLNNNLDKKLNNNLDKKLNKKLNNNLDKKLNKNMGKDENNIGDHLIDVVQEKNGYVEYYGLNINGQSLFEYGALNWLLSKFNQYNKIVIKPILIISHKT